MKSTGFRNCILIMAIVISILTLSCEDKINPTLEAAAPVLVVDAWLNNKAEPQVIILTQTQPYFENQNPKGVSGAIVTVADGDGKTYSFLEDQTNSGNYIWTPKVNETFGTIGKRYSLTIQFNGETFEATSKMNRVPAIDSITFDKEDVLGGSSTDKISYSSEFWATDPVGFGDAYWIRSYKNGVLLTQPSEINIAYDAGFSAGGDADGVVFIAPIRRGVNPNENDDNGNRKSPFEPGDSINVQINSITVEAFNYLNEVKTQTDRPGGFQELFSTPLANVSTNVKNKDSKGSAVVGFFNVSAVSVAGKKFKL